MIGRGKVFYEKLVAARGKVAKVAAHFITDGSVSIKKNRIFQLISDFSLYFSLLDYTYTFKIKSSIKSNEGSC